MGGRGTYLVLCCRPVRSLEEDPKAQEACFWRDMQAAALPPASQAASQKLASPAAAAAADNTGACQPTAVPVAVRQQSKRCQALQNACHLCNWCWLGIFSAAV